MRYKVFDVEILKTFEEVGGCDASSKMGVSCCVVYDSVTRSFRVFGDGEERDATAFILDADLVVGFNHVNFDWRVLQKIDRKIDVTSTLPLITVPQYDILTEMRKACNVSTYEKGYKLEQIAQANLGRGKRMSGELAPIAWQKGRYCEVIDHCIDDVALTRDLFELVLRDGKLIDPRTSQLVAFPDPVVFVQTWKESRRH